MRTVLLIASGLAISFGFVLMQICLEERGGPYEGETAAYGPVGLLLALAGMAGLCYCAFTKPPRRKRRY